MGAINPNFRSFAEQLLVQRQSSIILRILCFLFGAVINVIQRINIHRIVMKKGAEECIAISCISLGKQDMSVPGLINKAARNKGVLREGSHQRQKLAVFRYRETGLLRTMAFFLESSKNR